ncbi:IS3 family transposase [Niabella yanshanensis]|uniref:IS3 family transposase n=1 Tax=Niabella yanshanensis TaxID=577386 RepID=A0ABZ0W6E9_9BACT|nr:IS3 family transposase [Niabella yanshanensis]WQD37226.1 IS3 family transposase [Niabella yanshanensis]WQD37456.1 IS3 family transposase [Niabella yanshanensis]WQD38832.1 IS3 family transposase [Niabella yanshanensis]WQD38840.1 IS3 family transposase [Niabella yanshanensis]WQD39115.1 IS3 family transposase [Niabella yanshanensis]
MYFGYSRSGYYKSLRTIIQSDLTEAVVVDLVGSVRRYQPMIGGKKLYSLLKADLAKPGSRVGRDKFFDILRKQKLLIKRRRRYVTTTDSYHRFRKYNNKVKDQLLTGPGQVIVSDITYLRTSSGFVYLFLQTDAWSRKITGWHLSESLGIAGALKALEMSIRQYPSTLGTIHHSDRGIQYCCDAYVSALQEAGMEISMTEENHCYENAQAERVNGILKQEFLLDSVFADKQEAFKAVKEAIYTYNYRRPHWSLNLRIPIQLHNAA